MRWEPLSAAALAGGQSRRMGTDKALLPVEQGGLPMLALVLEQLETVADDLLVVAGHATRYEQFGAPVVPDLHSGVGTLGGIHAAISHAKHEHCIVVACDMPLLNPALLASMARTPRDYDVLVPVLSGESRQGDHGFVYQTLHAIYGKRCLPFIERRIAAGDRQVISFFGDIRVRTIDESEIRRFDPELRSFMNANTPEALAEVRRSIRGDGTLAR